MSATITVGTNSWVTEAEANTYFEGRIKASDYWTNGASDNIPALITAYNILNSGRFTFPSITTGGMKQAQYETALFLLQHQPDIDLRMGLIAQGVLAAGVVKERYKDKDNIEFPLPPIVHRLLFGYDSTKGAYMVDLERNEEYGVDYDAFTNRSTDES